MHSHLVGLDVGCLVRPFIYFHTLCVRIAKALARLCGCTGSPKPSLVVYEISTIISWVGSFEEKVTLEFKNLTLRNRGTKAFNSAEIENKKRKQILLPMGKSGDWINGPNPTTHSASLNLDILLWRWLLFQNVDLLRKAHYLHGILSVQLGGKTGELSLSNCENWFHRVHKVIMV